MQSRKDQLQAHYFVVGRLTSALLRAEPDAPQTPLRRFSMGVFVGVMLGIMGVVGVTIYGYIVPGGKKSWRDNGALIVEKETGTRYVYVGDELRPVLNYASGRLILGDDIRIMSVSRNSLRGARHGLPVGIPNAPDFLPEAKRLDGRQWQVCSGSGRDATNTERAFVTLSVLDDPAPHLPADRALLVRTPEGATYLAWNGRRFRIPSAAALAALGYGGTPRLPVGDAWLNALPAGPDLQAPSLPGLGSAGPQVASRSTRVGQVFVIESSQRRQHFVVLEDGLAPMTWTDATLLLGDAGTREAYPDGQPRALPLTPAEFGAARRSARSMATAEFPPAPVEAAAPADGAVPCVDVTVGRRDGAETALALLPASTEDGTKVRADAGDQALADRVAVQPGGGLLVRAEPGPGIPDGTLYLIVDVGLKYPLASAEVAILLGYAGIEPVTVPTTLLSLIPTGPSLDPTAARSSVPAVPERTAP